MKRSILPGSNVGRSLKRANSSLFSIATLVGDEPITDDGTIDIAEGIGSVHLPLDKKAGGGEAEASPAFPSKSSGLVPLDSDDDIAAADSSSESESNEQKQNQPSNGQDDDSAPDSAPDSVAGVAELFQKPLPHEKSADAGTIVTKTSGQDVSSRAATSRSVHTEAGRVEKQGPKFNDNRTGLVFESASNHFDRHNRFHKERPLRITSIHDYLSTAKKPSDGEKTVYERCKLFDSRGVVACIEVGTKRSPEELWLEDDDYLRVHLPGYMQRLDRITKCNCQDRLDVEAEQFKSIYFTSNSVLEAKAAASSFCNLVSRVVSGSLDNGFAVIRPPGHHAEPSLAGGYCVINNVAVAAAYAQEKLGMKRVLIVDWDVHHGNGTQKCFIDNPNILYFSAHRYDGGNYFPFQKGGGPSSVGKGAGEGYNINVGWNEKRIGDDEYLVLWERLLMPVAKEFNPDLVLVSAGFDAAQGDMGDCDISPECFARLTRRLKTLANGKVVCALEGGYVRSVLCKCVESVLASLLDAGSNEKSSNELLRFYKNVGDNEMLDCINSSAAKSIRETIKFQSKYWSCLKDEV